jgi:hypothetical protein
MKTLYQAFDHNTEKAQEFEESFEFTRGWTSCFFTPKLYVGMHSIKNLKDTILSSKGSHRTKSCRD